MNPALLIKNVTKAFTEEPGKKLTVLQDINLEISFGEFFIFLGPSGSGKSTLLRILSGLEKSHEGRVVLGNGLTAADFSFVFQQFALLPWLTVYQNVELGLISRPLTDPRRQKAVLEQLKQFGLERFAHAYPRELSGGMRQRVGIARALVTEPKVIFLDEPFSELDSFTVAELRQNLLEIWQKKKQTIIMVTHLIEEALELADRIAVLTPRPGKIEKIVANSLPRPRDKRSADFFRLEDELYEVIKP